ncbi:bifunctional acetate--CoA ligase family protein/GNAT family N-acetyltransferase [Massilia terrae]
MSIRNLEHLFHPHSLAIIGASERPGSVGATVLRNVLASPFRGPVYPVNPKYTSLAGRAAYASVAALPQAPELAVICTPAATVPGIIRELGERGTRAAVVLSAGLRAAAPGGAGTLEQAMLDAAKPFLLRILGPNCVGLLVPGIGLNASFAHTDALPGQLAFVSQSGALVTAVLDWAKSRGIGFSKFISLGDSADVDFGDALDYLARDPHTRAILLYMEDVRHARKFMSAARAAARSKPTLVIKSGRVPEGARAAASHTGALAGADEVYAAAIRRAGMLRVLSTQAMFAAVETLARSHPLSGERLAILTNGGGPGVMATDALVCAHGALATLAPDTLGALDRLLPAGWSRGNPVDIIGDASAERYRQALEILLQDQGIDAVLVIHAPVAVVASTDIARTIVELAAKHERKLLTCWLGGDTLAVARHMCDVACVPTFDTPEAAVDAFLQLVRYRRNQELLMQAPPAGRHDGRPDWAAIRARVREVIGQGRTMLSEPEAKEVLAACGIPVAATRVAANVDDAVRAASAIGYPVVLKILSPELSHKSDVGGVALGLESAEAVRSSADAMLARVAQLRPDARLQGFSVQAMVRQPGAVELIVGVASDPVFGPVILFGQGGTAVEVNPDKALALPPLNMVLARDLVRRTRVSRVLAGYRDHPPADLDAICTVLVQVAELVAAVPEIAELDINPLLAGPAGCIALDARIGIAAVDPSAGAFDRLAILPYPEEWERSLRWRGQDLLVRPIRPEDGAAHLAFFDAMSKEDVHMRVFGGLRQLRPSQLARLTQIDYDREMAFIATRPGGAETMAVARMGADPDMVSAEFALTVRSDLKGQGLGRLLMGILIDYCRQRGIAEIVGEALSENTAMLALARSLGFHLTHEHAEGVVHLRLPLR